METEAKLRATRSSSIASSRFATVPAHGLFRQRAVCESHHLLHFPEIQAGTEIPHAPRFYTSGVASPSTSPSTSY